MLKYQNEGCAGLGKQSVKQIWSMDSVAKQRPFFMAFALKALVDIRRRHPASLQCNNHPSALTCTTAALPLFDHLNESGKMQGGCRHDASSHHHQPPQTAKKGTGHMSFIYCRCYKNE